MTTTLVLSSLLSFAKQQQQPTPAFDPAPILATWHDAPRFSRRATDVDTWLAAVQAGCTTRRVDRAHWPVVARALLDAQARKRVDELEVVLVRMYGARYRFDWKRFGVAMRNMGWDIADDRKQKVRVATEESGRWWILGGGKAESSTAASAQEKGRNEKETADKANKKGEKKQKGGAGNEKGKEKTEEKKKKRAGDAQPPKVLPPAKKRAASEPALSRTTSWFSRGTDDAVAVSRPSESEARSWFWPPSAPFVTPERMHNDVTTTTVTAPLWLLHACGAFDVLNAGYPRTLTAVAAVLIAVGALPALPVAGGTVLASHAAQAAGAVAVGVGSWLRASQDAAATRTRDERLESSERRGRGRLWNRKT